MTRVRLLRMIALLALIAPCHAALAQGQDSTPGQRYLLVLAEMLPGIYDNANQSYFDRRRGLPEADRHPRLHSVIERVSAPGIGQYAFLWTDTVTTEQDEHTTQRLVTLAADGADDEVVMRQYYSGTTPITIESLAGLGPDDLEHEAGCDYRFRRRAGQFRGMQDYKACRVGQRGGGEVYTANTIELSAEDLFITNHEFGADAGEQPTGDAPGEPYWLERARVFHCYADIPGVGGGRDIPFERYDGITLHDRGDVHWFTTREDEPREIGIALRSVTWHVLNENNGNFNRDSLVLYTMEKLPDGTVAERGYTFTEPGARRLGINLKWMLVNCSMTPRDQARPEL